MPGGAAGRGVREGSDADYVVRVAVAGVADYERIHKEYLSRLPHVARIRSIFAMRTVYKSTAVEL